MKPRIIGRAALLAVALFLVAAPRIGAQTVLLRGQTLQPAYEGWTKNADGSFTMVFGYLNRNYDEELDIPIGPNNSFSPGPPDRGQPTHFYNRRQMFVFEVTVPADWGTKDLVWTVTRNGSAFSAVGSLLPVWEINEFTWSANRANRINTRLNAAAVPNRRPVIRLQSSGSLTSTVSEAMTLVAEAEDDGQPGPQKSRDRGESQATTEISPRPIPFFGANDLAMPAARLDKVSPTLAMETGLAVTWLHYRGEGSVSFEPQATSIARGKNGMLAGKATTLVRFGAPGTYVLRAVADDGTYTTPVDVTVIVEKGRESRQR